MIDELIIAARGWRKLAKLTVVVEKSETEVEELPVELGEPRRRWKRIAARLEPLADRIVAARGFNAKAEVVGVWEAPDDEPESEPELSAETDAMAAHRQHTQWVLREGAKLYEGVTRLQMELVGAVIDVVRALRTSVSTPAVPLNEDEASKTLGLLLQSFLASQNNRRTDDADDETERAPRRESGDPGVQGSPGEPGEART